MKILKMYQNSMQNNYISRRTFYTFDNVAFVFIALISLIVALKDSLTSYPFFLNLKIRGVDDLMNLILFGLMFLHMVLYRMKKKAFAVFAFIALVLFYSFLQSLILERSIAENNPFFLIRDSAWFITVYYFIVISKPLFLEKYKKLIYMFVVIQLIFFVFQQIYSIVVSQKILFEDNVNGSLGANMSHIIAFTLVLFFPFLISRKRKILFIGALMIFLLASARSCMVLAFVSFIVAFVLRLKPSRSIPLIIIFWGFAFSVIFIYSRYFQTALYLPLLLSQQNRAMTDKIKPAHGANRIGFLLYTINGLKNDDHLWFGHGIASYTSRTAIKTGGYKFKEFEKDFPFTNEYISGGSTYNVWLGELGIVGSALMVLFFLIFTLVMWRHPAYFGSFLTGFLGLIPLKLMESYAFGFFFWFLLAYYSCVLTKGINVND